MPRASINYALAATLVTQGVTLAEAAKQSGAKNANVLGVGLRRKGVTVTVARGREPIAEASKSITLRLATEAGRILKQDMGELIQTHVGQLKNVEAKPDLAHITKVGMALEPLVRSAKIVHDWGNEQSLGIVALGIVEHLDQAQDAMEVQSSVVPTTTESVRPEPPLASTPQEP